MSKKIVIFIFFVYQTVLIGAEPILATLNNIDSNEIQKFKIAQKSFYCRPYGVTSIDKLYSNSQNNSSCKKSIESFYKKNPYSKYFALKILKTKQMYHIEHKNDSCIVYAKGAKSYSELLLERGLAVIKPLFKDEEFSSSFKKAQARAKSSKLGIWKSNLLIECTAESYVE